jgi:hypothetical protein
MAFEPNKDRAYGSSENVISRLFKECGGVPKVMEALQLSRTRCYALSDPDDPAQISYERVVTLTKTFGVSAAAEHMAALAGGTFLPIAADEDEADWHALAAAAARRSAALTATMLESIGPEGRSPGAIDATEARALLAEVDGLMVVLAKQHVLLRAVADES